MIRLGHFRSADYSQLIGRSHELAHTVQPLSTTDYAAGTDGTGSDHEGTSVSAVVECRVSVVRPILAHAHRRSLVENSLLIHLDELFIYSLTLDV